MVYRIDVATATNTLPTPAALGTEGYWTKGNPGTGTPATVMDQDWFNALQENLIGVLTAAGVSHSKSDYTTLSRAIQTIAMAGQGSCRLAVSGGNVVLSPYQGNTVFIPGKGAMAIASAGVSVGVGATLTEGGTPSANTTYYVYAYNNSGSVALQLSATGHSTDTSTGTEIRTGDSTRALVGMVRVGSGPAFNTTSLGCLSWFNRRNVSNSAAFTAVRSTTSTSYTEINSEIEVNFLAWGDDSPRIYCSGYFIATSASQYTLYAALGIDSTSVEEDGAAAWGNINSNTFANPFALQSVRSLSEGWHTVTLLGKTNTGSISSSYVGGGSGTDRCSISVQVRG